MPCLQHNFKSGVVLKGRYRTISPLNHGSFGMVFIAEDIETNETVALKCLTKQSACKSSGLSHDALSEELVLHKRLGSHPNIVGFLDSFETESHEYIVLEFCYRGDLYEAICAGHGPMETEHVRKFMLQLIDAVQFMHARGIYHRDIKPENIFLSKSGTLKLGDFGLATTAKWSREAAVGSERYMAPEQFTADSFGYSPAQADIWAVGVCLLNILFSRNPFIIPTELDRTFQDYMSNKKSLFDLFPTMTQDTYNIIMYSMSPDPRKRSLTCTRDAIVRAASFTTENHTADDFELAERQALPTANRQPLRTPSIAKVTVESEAFPWAKALHAQPHQLSTIKDTDSYDEDLFSKSSHSKDWDSSVAGSSVAGSSVFTSSVLSSSISSSATSYKPIQATPCEDLKSLPLASPVPIPSRKICPSETDREPVSKTWRNLVEDTGHPKAPCASSSQDKSSSKVRNDLQDAEGELVDDGVFFFEMPKASTPDSSSVASTNPPVPQNRQLQLDLDRWAALGERRRLANGGPKSKPLPTKKQVQEGSQVKQAPPKPNQDGSGGCPYAKLFELKTLQSSLRNWTKMRSNMNDCSLSNNRGREWNRRASRAAHWVGVR